MIQQLLFHDDLDDPGATHHVHQIAAPGAVDARRHLEDTVHFIQPRARRDAAGLGLFPEGDDIWLNIEMLMGPPFPGGSKSRLDLVKDQQELMFVGQPPQFHQKFRTEMVVPAFPLDGFDDETGDVVWVQRHHGFDGSNGFPLGSLDLGKVFSSQREGELWIRNARPVELGEVLVFSRIRGVGERHGVTRAAVESLLEVNDLRSLFVLALRQILADLPVESGLQRILDGQGPSINPEQVGQVIRRCVGGEGLDPFGVVGGVDIRIGGLVQSDGAKVRAEFRRVQFRMAVPQGRRGEEGIKIQVFLPVAGVHDPGTMGLFQVHDQMESVHQNMALQGIKNFVGLNAEVGHQGPFQTHQCTLEMEIHEP